MAPAGPVARNFTERVVGVGVRCDADGTFHGFGEQYNATNQRGEVFQLLVNEQGNGRDGSLAPSVGNEHTTYFPIPYYIDAPIGSPPVYSLGQDREDLRNWEALAYGDCR